MKRIPFNPIIVTGSVRGFTLVELIVVITIVSILGTIGFFSLKDYLSQTRDSTRITDISSLTRLLEIQRSKGSKLPPPYESITINASGVEIRKQGYIGNNILSLIGASNGIKDPLNSAMYTYSTDMALNKFQILGFSENTLMHNSLMGVEVAQAADYSLRGILTRGDTLGVLLLTGSKTPVQELLAGIDVVTTPNEYMAFFTNTDYIVGTGSILSSVSGMGASSCKEILTKDSGNKGKDGVYYIRLNSTSVLPVYCDMSSDGGGWTMVMRGVSVDRPLQSNWSNNNDYQISAFNVGTSTFKYSSSTIRTIRSNGYWRVKGTPDMSVTWYGKNTCDFNHSTPSTGDCLFATVDSTYQTGWHGKTIPYSFNGIGGYYEGTPNWKCSGVITYAGSEIWNLCRNQSVNPGPWGCTASSPCGDFTLWVK